MFVYVGVSGVLHLPKTNTLVLHQENSKKRKKKVFWSFVMCLRMRKMVKVLLWLCKFWVKSFSLGRVRNEVMVEKIPTPPKYILNVICHPIIKLMSENKTVIVPSLFMKLPKTSTNYIFTGIYIWTASKVNIWIDIY